MRLNETMNNPESSNKVLIDPTIPIEDLLGSVTTYNNVEGSEMKSLQLRTSARVFKKMKLDSALAALPVPEKKEPEKKEDPKPELKKPLPRPLWSQEDKNLFFEGLNEFGKDFDAIHSFLSTKLKKKGLPENAIKTREQVRHLYYRTWHKISKYLKFSNDVKKLAQELYGLINYGELRKKLTSVSEKTCIKLNELIYRGSLAIRVKGKTIRIKTPMCKALRRLNQLDEKNDDIKLPSRISVELRPKNMNTWMRVQEVSQNPRIKTVLPLQKRLSSLLTYMSERWKSQEVIEHEKLVTAADSMTLEQAEEKLFEEQAWPKDPPLRIWPPSDCPISVPTINISEFFTTQSICMNSYEERIGVKTCGEQLWLEAYPKFNFLNKGSRRGVKRSRTGSVSDKQPSKPTCTSNTDNNENCVTDSECGLSKVDEFIDEAVNTILALQSGVSSSTGLGVQEEESKGDAVKVEEDCLIQVKKEHDIAKIKLGWTLQDCGTLTIGDLYLMFGTDSKVVLEYSWDEPESFKLKTETADLTEEKLDGDVDDDAGPTDVSVTLKRLLSLAKLHYRKNMVKCPCGHVCGSPSKTAAAKPKTTGRTIKTAGSSLVEIKQENQQVMSTVVNVSKNNITTTAGMVPIVIQPQMKKFSPSSLFRRPISPNDNLRAQLDSIQRLKPKYCNRRGRRTRSKQVVVERKLPLLANKADSRGQIVQMNIISQDLPRQAPKIVPQIDIQTSEDLQLESTLAPVSVASGEGSFSVGPMEQDILDNATSGSRVGSPTSISNLLDLALQSHGADGCGVEDGARSKESSGITSFVGLLPTENVSSSTPPASPSRILKENENQWLNAEVADFSFSSFLGHLESPMKANQSSSNLPPEDSRLCLSQDVDAHLQSLLTETSLDYTAKFADLAAQVTDTKNSKN